MSNSDRHVLLIGGCGYIGSVLAGRLLQSGYRVRILDRLIYGNGETVADWIERPEFSLIVGDMCDSKVVSSALEGVTDVILLAALVGDPICKKYPDEARRVNQDGARLVFDMACEAKGVDRFLFFSTCSNYGLYSGPGAADENAPLNPQSLYAETKVAMEQYILEQAAGCPLAPTILRLATAYGLSRRMRFDLTVSEFTRELFLGHELLVYDENTWRPYCHVQDISTAASKVLESDIKLVSGEVFNVGGNDENYTKKMIVEIIQKQLPDAKVKYNSGGSDPRDYRVSFDKIRNSLLLSPCFDVDAGVNLLLTALENDFYPGNKGIGQVYGNYTVTNIER